MKLDLCFFSNIISNYHIRIFPIRKDRNMKDIENLLAELPPIFGRRAVDSLLPGIITSSHLANLDSKGIGPKKRKFGRNVFYRRDDFVAWFVNQIDNIEK